MKISEFALNLVSATRKLDQTIYQPAYHVWHVPAYADYNPDYSPYEPRPDKPDICYVCLAGAWIAAKKALDHTQYYKPTNGYKITSPDGKEDITLQDMLACEAIRTGHWKEAAEWIGAQPIPEIGEAITIRPKHRKFLNWKQFMLCLDEIEKQAKVLQTFGF